MGLVELVGNGPPRRIHGVDEEPFQHDDVQRAKIPRW